VVSGRSFGSSVVSLACITSMCSVQCFRGDHSLRLAFGLNIINLVVLFNISRCGAIDNGMTSHVEGPGFDSHRVRIFFSPFFGRFFLFCFALLNIFSFFDRLIIYQ